MDFSIDNTVTYALAAKTGGSIYKTCYVYADGLFIGKVYGPSSKPSQYKAYVHLDHLGSVRVITDSSGTVMFTIRYEPYGKTWSTSGSWKSNVKYLQRVRDEASGLYCLGVRFYDGEIGRFISEDPVLGSLSSPLTINRYSYSICDPINGKDPDGRFFNLIAGAIGAVAGFIIGGVGSALTGGDFWAGAIGGAVGGVVAGFTCGASLLTTLVVEGAMGGALSSFTTSMIETGGNLGKSVQAAVVGSLSGVVGVGVGAAVSKVASKIPSAFSKLSDTIKKSSIAREIAVGMQKALPEVSLINKISMGFKSLDDTISVQIAKNQGDFAIDADAAYAFRQLMTMSEFYQVYGLYPQQIVDISVNEMFENVISSIIGTYSVRQIDM